MQTEIYTLTDASKLLIEFIWSHVKKFEPKAMKVALELMKVCEI